MTRAVLHLACAMCALVLATMCPHAAAHPLGNNTVSRQAVLDLSEQHVVVSYRMDLAEIPTLAAADEADRDGDGSTSQGEWQAYAGRWSRDVERALTLTSDGRRIRLAANQPRFRLRPGEAGVATLFLETELRGAWAATAQHEVRYSDEFRSRDSGWKELMVRERPGLRIDGAVARSDRSRKLSVYPRDGALPQEVSAAFRSEWTRPPQADPSVAAAEAGLQAALAPREPEASAAPAMLTASPNNVAASGKGATGASLSAFFVLGMHHIAVGIDHLAFLLGLLLLSQRLVELIKLISAFTVAHSVTLMLAASHLVSPPGAWVEPAIAFTIAYVGFMAWRRRARGHGAVLAFAFGLVHGFGFAGALAETLGDTSNGAHWLLELLAFNLGIETFQITLVVCAVALAARMRSVPWRASVHAAASLAVFGSGLTWLVLRLLAPGQA